MTTVRMKLASVCPCRADDIEEFHDLLEACKAAVDALTGSGSIKERDLEEWAQLALHKCNLAIRKAEGCLKVSS